MVFVLGVPADLAGGVFALQLEGADSFIIVWHLMKSDFISGGETPGANGVGEYVGFNPKKGDKILLINIIF